MIMEALKQKTWREIVGEEAFTQKMRLLKIGPGLWDGVVMDNLGNVLKVDGLPYEEWDASFKKEEEVMKDKNYTDI